MRIRTARSHPSKRSVSRTRKSSAVKVSRDVK
jgi:hypothetical protein